MSDESRQNEGDSGVKPGKKPYHKPAFTYEQVFERTALSCGKINPSQLQCRTVRKS